MADDLKYRQKYKDLRKRIRDIEEENDVLNVRLYKARKSIRHLKLERTFLLDRMEKASHPTLDDNSDNSDIGSDIYSHDEASDMLLHKLSNGHHGKQHGINSNNKMEKSIVNKPQRKKKDPNAPKGPGNVFFLYCRLERDKMKDEHPTENLGEVTRLLGQRWKGLSKEEKKKYYDMYKQELDEFEVAMKAYTANGGSSATTTAVTAATVLSAVTEASNIDHLDTTHGVSTTTMSSPAQSTEISMDFHSDPLHQEEEEEEEEEEGEEEEEEEEEEDVGSFMDEDDIDTTKDDDATIYQQQQQQVWQSNTGHNQEHHYHAQ